MYQVFPKSVWAFDCEWVPDARAARRLSGEDFHEEQDAFAWLWKKTREREGTSVERPFLKLIHSRLASIAAVVRRGPKGSPELSIASLPKQSGARPDEREIIGAFLSAVGRERPQLVGFNSQNSDLPILIQRGIACGVSAGKFCEKPDKPWLGYDYLNRYSEGHIDLMQEITGYGARGAPSLNDLALACSIPGKLDVAGDDVAELWLGGQHQKIVRYNETDALTTYLVWLRLSKFSGHFTDEQYEREQDAVRAMLESKASTYAHLARFLDVWNTMRDEENPDQGSESPMAPAP